MSTRRSTSRPTIMRARLSSVAPSTGTVSTFFPRRRTVMRSATSSTSWSLWRDEDDRLPLRLQLGDDREQLLRLLRGQDGRRLVEHEDLRPAVEGLQDLDALLRSDGDVLDATAGVDREAVAVGEVADTFPRLPEVEHHPRVRGLFGENDVLGHGHHRDEHEVLVHHPDPALDRVLGRRERRLLPVEEDLPRVRVVEPVEDVHQRRLAGAVLAEQRMHLAGGDVEVDVVVGEHAGEALGDPAELENGWLGPLTRRFCHAEGRALRPAFRRDDCMLLLRRSSGP